VAQCIDLLPKDRCPQQYVRATKADVEQIFCGVVMGRKMERI